MQFVTVLRGNKPNKAKYTMYLLLTAASDWLCLRLLQSTALLSLVFGITFGLSAHASNTPQTHDVPPFHNDDGFGLLQDCQFLRAIANGEITDIPTTVNTRSTNCLASIKSVVHVLYSLQNTNDNLQVCIPSDELDWLEELTHITAFLEEQPRNELENGRYGNWIVKALSNTYPCT